MIADTGVFIPAYNVARHLEGVVARIPQDAREIIRGVWIIDDGSRDETAKVAEEIARNDLSVHVVLFEQNRGYGAVVRKGIALCQKESCEFAVCLHGDGQYPSEVIRPFIEHMRERSLDVLQGSRHAGKTARKGGMPLYKIAAGKALVALENAVFGLKMTDYHSGFIMYGKRAMAVLPFERLSGSFDIDLEIIACARARGLAIGELPIPTRYADEISHVNPVTYGLRVIRVLWRYVRGRYRS